MNLSIINNMISIGKPSPRVLIIAPTRELAMQSHQVVLDVGGPKGVCIYGGVPKPSQKVFLCIYISISI
jgi:ATP-dependent RNA helicase DBP3